MKTWGWLSLAAGLAVWECSCAASTQIIRRNERLIVSRMRSIANAEAAYASVNGGAFDTLACLQSPASCLPNYPEGSPSYLPGGVPSEQAAGYRGRFYPGERIHAARDAGISPSSVTAWAYAAVPSRRSGKRAFCVDSTGRVCTTTNRRAPKVLNTACPSTCLTVP